MTCNISQKDVTNKMNEVRHDEVINYLQPHDKAVRRNAAAKGASAWMCMPCLPAHTLPDTQYRVAALRRVHAPIPNHEGTFQHRKPDGTKCNEVPDPFGTHAAACRAGGGECASTTQSSAPLEIGQHTTEQKSDSNITFQKPTLTPKPTLISSSITRLTQPALIDVTIVNSAAAEYLTASRDGAAADTADQARRNKYPGVCLTPFVLEEHG